MKNHDPVETTPNDFREALALLEQRLRDCEDSDSLIDGLLEGTAQFYGADRAYIIEADWELGIGLNTYSRAGRSRHCSTGADQDHRQTAR